MSKNTHYGIESHAPCYDLVAARWTKPNYDRTLARSIGQTETLLSPEDFLLRKHRKLDHYPFIDHKDLPDSDLLAAIHYYISKKVEKQTTRESAYGVYDLTALIAIGIEVEEAVNDLLGDYGHLMYAEPVAADEPNTSSNSSSAEEDESLIEEGSSETEEATSESLTEEETSFEETSAESTSESMEVDNSES